MRSIYPVGRSIRDIRSIKRNNIIFPLCYIHTKENLMNVYDKRKKL
jgi:hypothetical protein